MSGAPHSPDRMTKRLYIETVGCQMNVLDSELVVGSLRRQGYELTLNATDAIRPETIIARMTYHHPLFTPEGVAAQLQHRVIDGIRRTYYCGAWWRYGFHEDGMVSALDAVRHFESDYGKLPVRRLGAA